VSCSLDLSITHQLLTTVTLINIGIEIIIVSQEQIEVPLNSSLKVPGDGDDQNATEGGKDVSVTLTIQSSEGGSPTQVPLTANIPNDTQTQDLEVCGTFQGGNEMCQSLEEIVSEQGENQTSSAMSNESIDSSDSTDKNEDNEDN
jgi:hypothetical protein